VPTRTTRARPNQHASPCSTVVPWRPFNTYQCWSWCRCYLPGVHLRAPWMRPHLIKLASRPQRRAPSCKTPDSLPNNTCMSSAEAVWGLSIVDNGWLFFWQISSAQLNGRTECLMKRTWWLLRVPVSILSVESRTRNRSFRVGVRPYKKNSISERTSFKICAHVDVKFSCIRLYASNHMCLFW